MRCKNEKINVNIGTNYKKAKKEHRAEDESSTKTMEEYERELKEVETLRQVIMSCSEIPSKCRAVHAALKALDNEEKKILRDEKLRKKFSTSNKNENKNGSNLEEDEIMSDDYHKVENQEQSQQAASKSVTGDDLLMEWQDVEPPPKLLDDDALADACEEVLESDLGRSLCDSSVRSIASSNTQIDSPLSAIALAIHGALLCEDLRFKCTGIPSPQRKSGFAAPIRELPKGKFLPDKWDAHSQTHISLRYRKDGYGAAVLIVTLDNDKKHTQVYFGPSGEQREQIPQLQFKVEKHINLDSFDKALSSSTTNRVPPSLHYKSLSILLTEFAKCVDLGQTYTDHENTNQSNTNINTNTNQPIYVPPQHLLTCSTTAAAPTYEPPKIDSYLKDGDGTLENHVIHPIQPLRGDFETDLNPLLIRGPSLPLSSGGNLMGPNHPSFQRHGDGDIQPGYPMPDGFPLPGGLGMQPRFDSYYPPGVTGPVRGRGRGRRHPTGGDPNPDLLKPPSNLGDDMFM